MSDWKVIDMPTTLSRVVLRQDEADSTQWVRDSSWYRETAAKYSALFDFFRTNELIVNPIIERPVDNIVLHLSELTPLGQRLAQSGAIDRWLASFDQPGRRKGSDDVRPLIAALRHLKNMD